MNAWTQLRKLLTHSNGSIKGPIVEQSMRSTVEEVVSEEIAGLREEINRIDRYLALNGRPETAETDNKRLKKLEEWQNWYQNEVASYFSSWANARAEAIDKLNERVYQLEQTTPTESSVVITGVQQEVGRLSGTIQKTDKKLTKEYQRCHARIEILAVQVEKLAILVEKLSEPKRPEKKKPLIDPDEDVSYGILSTRASHCLMAHGIKPVTPRSLWAWLNQPHKSRAGIMIDGWAALAQGRNVGVKTLKEYKDVLRKAGYDPDAVA